MTPHLAGCSLVGQASPFAPGAPLVSHRRLGASRFPAKPATVSATPALASATPRQMGNKNSPTSSPAAAASYSAAHIIIELASLPPHYRVHVPLCLVRAHCAHCCCCTSSRCRSSPANLRHKMKESWRFELRREHTNDTSQQQPPRLSTETKASQPHVAWNPWMAYCTLCEGSSGRRG